MNTNKKDSAINFRLANDKRIEFKNFCEQNNRTVADELNNFISLRLNKVESRDSLTLIGELRTKLTQQQNKIQTDLDNLSKVSFS